MAASRTRQCDEGGEGSCYCVTFVQCRELKYRTKLAEEPAKNRSRLRPAKLAWLAMASVLLLSVLVVAPLGVVQGNEIRASQARPGLKKGAST